MRKTSESLARLFNLTGDFETILRAVSTGAGA